MALERFALAMQARQQVEGARAGAQFLTLLSAIQEKGWTGFLAAPRTVDELAEFAGLPAARVADVLAALEGHGVVEQADGKVRLTAPFEAYTAADSWVPLTDKLAETVLDARLIRDAVADPEPLALTEDEALVVANAVGGRTTDVSKAVYQQLLDQVPELAERVRGRWLDVGCGVACASLTFASLVPEMRTVAVELVPAVAAEAARRAAALGVADRVEIRRMDARDLAERDEFGGAFWAQPFFPESSRAATLAAIRRALRPGGLLFAQEMEVEPADEGRPAYLLRRLAFRGLGVPFGPTAEQLSAEAVAAGFEPVRIATTDFGRLVITRRPG